MTDAETVERQRSAEMTPEGLIFDIAGIDLAAIRVTREQLKSWNPHRGTMAMLDGVVWHSDNFRLGIGVRHVLHDEFWVEGHFPERPLMPGVLMIEAGAQLGSFLFYSRLGKPCIAGFTRIEETVFRTPVVPGDTLYLLSNALKYSPRRFVTRIQGIVEGRICFESLIHGMVIR
jgi:3-hydroxyacyl-[acyl-carrier-protein] dehydratase